MTSAALPPWPLSPPLAVITPNDQRGAIYVTTALCLAVTAICLVVRLYVRVGFGQSIGFDDYTIAGSFLFMIANAVATFASGADGLGLRSSLVRDADRPRMEQAMFATDILFIVALWLSRVSSCFFFQRLSQAQRHTLFWNIMIGAAGVLAVASIFVVAIRCNAAEAWLFIDEKCSGLYDRWIVVTVMGLAFEALLIAQPALLIWNLQMAVKLKLKVIAAFAVRLILVVPIVLQMISEKRFYDWSKGDQLSSSATSAPFIFRQIVLAVAIITPTVPLLQPFMQATATTFGMVSGEQTNSYGDQSGRHKSRSNWMRQSRSHFSNNPGGSNLASQLDDKEIPLRVTESSVAPDQYHASISHQRKTSSNGSDISQLPMIRRDVQVTVSYSNGEPS